MAQSQICSNEHYLLEQSVARLVVEVLAAASTCLNWLGGWHNRLYNGPRPNKTRLPFLALSRGLFPDEGDHDSLDPELAGRP
jgi:hypothetical protein